MSSSSFAEHIEQTPELLVQAEARLSSHDFTGAIALLEPAFHSEPDNLDIIQALMLAYQGAGDAAGHEEMMGITLQKSSEPSPKLAIAYAELAMTRRDWSDAAGRWQFIIDRCAGFPHQVYVRQARAWLAAQQFSAALRAVSLALERQPANPAISDLRDVIASQKAKKFQLTAHKLAAPLAIRWDIGEGQKPVTTLESFRHYRIRGWIDARQDQRPELIAISPAGTVALALSALEPTTPFQEAGWAFEYDFDLSGDLTLGVRLEDGRAYECLRFSLASVMEVVEGREEWLFLANDTNASIDQFTGKRRLGSDEKQAWQRFAAEFVPLQQQRSVLFLIANSKEKVRPEYYPYEKADITTTEQVSAILKQKDIDYCNPVTAMQAVRDSYYPTDTHWSGRGAYLAFTACMRYFGFDDEFDSLYAFESREVVGDLGSKMDPPAKSLSTVAVYRGKSSVTCRFSNYLPGTGNITIFENDTPVHVRTLVIFGGSSAGAGGFATLFANVFQRVVVINLPGSHVQEVIDHENADYVISQTNERYLATPGRIVKMLTEANFDQTVKAIPAAERAKLLERMQRHEPCEFYQPFMENLLAPSEAAPA